MDGCLASMYLAAILSIPLWDVFLENKYIFSSVAVQVSFLPDPDPTKRNKQNCFAIFLPDSCI